MSDKQIHEDLKFFRRAYGDMKAELKQAHQQIGKHIATICALESTLVKKEIMLAKHDRWFVWFKKHPEHQALTDKWKIEENIQTVLPSQDKSLESLDGSDL